MFRLFYTPAWFNGWDIVFDVVGLAVAILIALYCWKIYRISGERKFQFFSLAFLMIGFALAMKGLTAGANYFTPIRNFGDLLIRPALGETRQYSVILYRLGFFFQMASMLGAWLLIFFISQKSRGRLKDYYETSQIGLFVYLVLLIAVISNFEGVVFFTTSIVLLSLIVLNYYKNYLNKGRNKRAFQVMLSFFLILVGNIFFVFVSLWEVMYVVGEVLVLLGFLLLLYTYNRIK